ncbi:glycosyltransferase WbuB [Nonlabens dokdonensis]|uniref:Glycosyltransferase WbuB n=1 Tax=Nonlabens dokdonensis TaxID=328515 RepID=A0A1Z8AG37_9FLAO|nr:WcaI family glycosyltransferase [Nonlabens dokdonensis]OUS09319.1 glycosyltransferase WbuB [Nonlabens dokdonensis]
MKGKHITFIGLNYAPEDTAIGLYSTQMVEALISAGATVSVVTAFPYYPQWKIAQEYQDKPNYLQENHKNVKLYRYKQYVPEQPTFLKRIIHILSFTKGSFFNLRKIKHTDLVISIIPFTSSAWLGNYHARNHKAKTWIHIQDFEFDAALQSGLSSGGKKFIFKFLFSLEKRILGKANRISTISHNMIVKLQSKTNQPTYYLPNWIDENQVNPTVSKQHDYLKSNKFKLLYSGNVGDKQDWDYFSAFAKALPQQSYEIIIVGAGAKYQQLKESIQQENIHFYDPVPFEELSDLLCSADAHFLFQKTEVLDTVMPSKLLGMMASEKPSLVLGNEASEVKTVMNNANAGRYFSEPDVQLAIQQLEAWRADKDLRKKIGIDARNYVVKHFSRKEILNKWIAELSQLVGSNS